MVEVLYWKSSFGKSKVKIEVVGKDENPLFGSLRDSGISESHTFED